MIVRRAGTFLYLITQPDHAALAARIMTHWQPLQSASRRAAILHAVKEHDNGWREPDASPTVNVDSGRIHDFITAPVAIRQGVWPRGIARLVQEPWAAALVAQHAITVYDRYRSDPEWQHFFGDLEVIRNRLLAETPLTLDDLSHDYDFVRIGDLISLIFCNQWDEERYSAWTFRRDADRVIVTPDPFSGQEVAITVPACHIGDRRFASDAELRIAVRTAPVVTLTGTVGGA